MYLPRPLAAGFLIHAVPPVSVRPQDSERPEKDRAGEGPDHRGQDVRPVHVLLRSRGCQRWVGRTEFFVELFRYLLKCCWSQSSLLLPSGSGSGCGHADPDPATWKNSTVPTAARCSYVLREETKFKYRYFSLCHYVHQQQIVKVCKTSLILVV